MAHMAGARRLPGESCPPSRPRRFSHRLTHAADAPRHGAAKNSRPRASFASTSGAMILSCAPGRPLARDAIAAHRGGTIMATVTTIATSSLPAPRARIGMIIPSVNSMTEPQFNHFAPPGLGVHVARTSAKLLADVAPDLIVFHCTDTSMTQGPQGEGNILEIVQDATGIEAVATSRLVLEALQALGLRRLVLLSPHKSNQTVVDYLGATRFTLGPDAALARKALEFATVTPREWVELARKHDRAEADGIFLSCTNTTQIEAIADIEQALGKPVVNSNQAVLWGCVKRLKSALAPLPPMPSL